jgi:hypothetical protein
MRTGGEEGPSSTGVRIGMPPVTSGVAHPTTGGQSIKLGGVKNNVESHRFG